MNIEITGKVVNVLPTQSGHGKNGDWVKNSFVIEWQDNGRNQLLCLEVGGSEKWDKMRNAVRVGNTVLCKFSVASREWNQKWFTSCSCFYCSSIGGSQHQQGNAQTQTQQTTQAPQVQGQQQNDSSIPF